MLKHALGAAVAGLVLVSLLPAGAARAAGCSGSGCTGKDPGSTGCRSSARTIDRVTPAGGGPEVELQNSTGCSAAFARIQAANSNWRFKIQIRDGDSYLANASPDRQAYTAMVGNGNAYRACVEQYDGAGGTWSCTGWH
ncbi:DUF2690 domain-containing protein [Kitasatospora sp. NPDC092039]|uniref:DUF2690 domain-containing protein n=1 Tax=Kitasatospora sp. NPDC092039 TaxID=3364086 RepID=UPI003803BAE4